MSGKIYIIVIAAISSIVLRNEGFREVSLFFMLALFYFLYKHKSNEKMIIASVIIFMFFFYHPHYFTTSSPVPASDSLIGEISSLPKFDGDKISFQLTDQQQKNYQMNYFAKSIEEKQQLENLFYGMVCSLEGQFKAPPEARNFYSFNYKDYLKTKDIHYLFTPNNFSIDQCHCSRETPLRLLQKYRQKGIHYIKSTFPEGSKGIVIALIFGERSEIDDEILQSYQSLGIIHLLAVSGLHVGLVSASLYFIFIRIGITKERSMDVLMILLPIYMIVAGAAPSVIRAATMTMIVLLSIRVRFKLSPLDGISIICLGLLFINPYYVEHIGFQLSFLISYTLIISAASILHRFQKKWSQLLAVTILAQVVSFPIIIYHFYEISLWSIPLNLLYIPFITLFTLPLSFILVTLSIVIPSLAKPLIDGFNFVVVWAHQGLEFVRSLPFATLTFGKPPLYLVVLYYLTVGLNLLVWEGRKSLKHPLVATSLLFLLLVYHWNLPYLSNVGEITMIDVGQGDSILIELPNRRAVYLIDTGGMKDYFEVEEWQERERSFHIGEDVLLPYLKAKGIRTIDKLFLTHGHYDHIGSAEALIGQVQVKQLYYTSLPIETKFEKDLLNLFQQTGTEIKFVKNGHGWKVGKNEFYILSPFGSENHVNDSSMVIFASIGSLTWLFTGDLEKEGELNLLSHYPKLNVDVLKIGHHGSNTSTSLELLEALSPRYSLISVGQNNRYGHPHLEVLKRLKDHNVGVFRTDIDGAIRYRFKDGSKGSFETVITPLESAATYPR